MTKSEIETELLSILAAEPSKSWKKVRLAFYLARHNPIRPDEAWDAIHAVVADGRAHENGYAWLHPYDWNPGDSRNPSPAPY